MYIPMQSIIKAYIIITSQAAAEILNFILILHLKSNYKKIISPKGKVALVTGGSGRIGSIFVSLFLLNDFTVISTSRNKIKFNDFYK